MKISFLYGSGVLTLPAKAIELLSRAGETELKVLLKLASHGSGSEINPAGLAVELGMS